MKRQMNEMGVELRLDYNLVSYLEFTTFLLQNGRKWKLSSKIRIFAEDHGLRSVSLWKRNRPCLPDLMLPQK